MYTDIVRVGVANNFNGTDKEFNQLKYFSGKFPNKYFFVNSNINSKGLKNISVNPFKAVITVNPNLVVKDIPAILAKLNPIKNNISFVRVKYMPDNADILNLIKVLVDNNIPIVITNQRFKSRKSMAKYSNEKYYKHKNGYFRLSVEEKSKLESIVDSLNKVYICDRKGQGCQSCGLCSKLTSGFDLPIASMNLSTSGICPFNCPDCFSKASQKQYADKLTGKVKISFDKIGKNSKQKGTLKMYTENK
jgi:hypothetical protein